MYKIFGNQFSIVYKSNALLLDLLPIALYSLYRKRQSQFSCFRYSSLTVRVNKMENTWPKVILFGDSLTQYGFSKDGCWTALVADHLQRKCDVINRGFSGYNTRWCKIILPKLVTKKDVEDIKMITIFLGANDSVDSTLCPKQHVPLEEFTQNLTDMIQYLQDIGVARQKIVLISPPPCDEQKWEADCKEKGQVEKKDLSSFCASVFKILDNAMSLERKLTTAKLLDAWQGKVQMCSTLGRVFGKYNKPTKTYAAACKEVAQNVGTAFVDLYTAMSNQKHWEEFLNDGLHFSTLGSEFLFEQLKPCIDKLTSDLPLQLPLWADIDNNNPHALLDTF